MAQSKKEAMLRSLIKALRNALSGTPEDFRSAIDDIDFEQKSKIIEKMQDFGTQKLFVENAPLISAYIKRLVAKNPTDAVFYEKLMLFLKDKEIFDDESLDAALLLVAISTELPYSHRRLLTLSDDEFIEICEKYKKEHEDLTRIRSIDYEQKTETASAVMDVLDKADDRRERIVLLALWNGINEGINGQKIS